MRTWRRAVPALWLALACTLGVLHSEPSKAEIPVASRMVVSCPTATTEEFQTLVTRAKAIGATHIDISDLPKARWQWFDPNDPYPNWSLISAGIIKTMVPKELQPEVPTGTALQSQKILAERGEILRKAGMRAFFRGAEPMWLPESVYQKHPDWRGPRCQSPIRSRHDYFAPCIDNPEVLAFYREATAALCRLVPVDDFAFLVNDSGSGVCWHPGLYPGKNGPEACKDRPMPERLNGFMKALRDGASDAGIEANVRFAGSESLVEGSPTETVSAGYPFYIWSSKVYPVPGIPDPVRFSEGLEAAFSKPHAEWRIGIPVLDSPEYFSLVEYYRTHRVEGPLGREAALQSAATSLVGEAEAHHLCQAWHDIHEAIQLIQTIDVGGPVLTLGCLNQRWLNRPLVPFPLELKPEEKTYYRKFQFQAQTEEKAANLMECQGLFMISGDTGTGLAHAIFEAATKKLQSASRQLGAISTANPEAKRIAILRSRVEALILVIRNADLAAAYQAFLDRFRPEWNARPDKAGYAVPEVGIELVNQDVANTRALMALIDSALAPVIDVAARAEEEDCFQFGPAFRKQLEMKIETELRHLPDHQRLLHP